MRLTLYSFRHIVDPCWLIFDRIANHDITRLFTFVFWKIWTIFHLGYTFGIIQFFVISHIVIGTGTYTNRLTIVSTVKLLIVAYLPLFTVETGTLSYNRSRLIWAQSAWLWSKIKGRANRSFFIIEIPSIACQVYFSKIGRSFLRCTKI